MTNHLPWTTGYFQFIENRALVPMDRLPRHCFKDSRAWYFDEYGKGLSKPAEPVGDWGLHSFRTINDAISKALGIPVARDD